VLILPELLTSFNTASVEEIKRSTYTYHCKGQGIRHSKTL